jgi:hypothetical protein
MSHRTRFNIGRELIKGKTMYEGSCLCGSIRYSIASELSDFGYCHCISCRKASGTACAANAGVDRGAFRLEDPSMNRDNPVRAVLGQMGRGRKENDFLVPFQRRGPCRPKRKM